MKKIFFLLTILISLQCFSQTFNYQRSWATYFGDDSLRVLDNDIDSDGNIYLVGFVNKQDYTDSNFSTTSNVYQTIYGGGNTDGFITKINPEGNVVWSTYFGGENNDIITGLTIDNNNNIYIIGATSSTTNISTPGSYQPTLNGYSDNFIAKFSNQGIVSWSTYYGGYDTTYLTISDNQIALAHSASDIICDNQGNLYFHNTTDSNGLATLNAFQSTLSGGSNTGLISKFTDNGQRIWATYYGINNSRIQGISVSSSGLYIMGLSLDCPPNFTSNTYFGTAGSHQPLPGGCKDIFLTRFSFAGDRLWSTYYGNSYAEYLGKNPLISDDNDNVYITGSVSGNTNIATTGSFQETNVNGYTNFLAKFNQDGVREWGTYYGTYINTSAGFSFPVINKDNNGNIYLSNYNNGLGNIATSGSYQESLAGSFDCFTAKFSPNGQRLWGTYYGGSELEFTPMKTLIGNNDNFYIVGMTQSQNNISTIGSLQPVYSTNTFQSSYPTNIFIAKFSPIPLNIIDFNNSKFKIFPNPTNQYFIVGNNNNNNNNFFDYKITDLAGRIVKNGNSKFNEQIDVEDLSSGNYIIKIVEENGTSSNYKLIKN